MPSLFPLNICLTAWHCLRAGYLFTAPARLGGTKGTVSCGSSPGSPWKRRVSSPLCSGVVVASGRGQMWLCSVDSWAQIRPQSLPHRTREESIILQTRPYEQESKKKIILRTVVLLSTNTVETLCPEILLSKLCATTTPSRCYICYFRIHIAPKAC